MKLYWRNHPILQKIQQALRDNTCGELCSLRFTWQRPKKSASGEETFLYETFASALDGAQTLAVSALARLEIEKVPGMNILFALAYFENGIGAEFELNECLPDSMLDTCFLKANFTHGHITNQPIVGHFNEEGMVLASDEKMECLIVERSDLPAVCGPIEQMKQRWRESGAEVQESKLISRIKEALA
jgi:hypothetical protein